MAKQPLWSTAVQLGTSAMISIHIFSFFWFPTASADLNWKLPGVSSNFELFVQNVASWYLEVDCCWSRALPGNWHQLIQKIAARQGRESTIGAATKLNQNHRAFESFNSGHLLEGRLVETTSGAETKSHRHFVRHSFQTKLSIQSILSPQYPFQWYVFKTQEMKCKSRPTKNAVVALECESL